MGNLLSNDVEQVVEGALLYKVKSSAYAKQNGANGANAANGANGANGFSGANGANGVHGVNGVNGVDGSKHAGAKEDKEDTFVFDENYEGDSNEVYEHRILWGMVLYWIVTHALSLAGLVMMFTTAKWQTSLYAISLFYIFLLGIPAGAHRLWAHRSYKARTPLRALLFFLCSVAASGSIWSWAVIHRIHHKYSDTNADPVNSKRGFWFSHIGWTMQTVHPKVVEKAKNVDFSDLEADAFVRFNRDHYTALIVVFCYVLPAAIPVYYWGENVVAAFLICSVLRHVMQLHGTFSINSFAHMFGDRPYNANIKPTQNFWANFYTFGEGFHNYHHQFPMDYRASEFGWSWNMTTFFLDCVRSINWAYDCKTTSPDVIEKTKANNARRLNAKAE